MEKYKVNDLWRLFFATGFVGAYTTFSSFDNEALALYRQNYVGMGLLYSGLSLVLGLMAVTSGLLVARLVAFGRFVPPAQTAAKVVSASQSGPLPMEEHTELEKD